MNYLKPRQVDPSADRDDAGKWRYTCMNDGRVWPVGYCAKDCPGHDTPEEANAHQRDYELDNAVFTEGPSVDEALDRYRCQARANDADEPSQCGKLTTSVARVGSYQRISLCVDHLNRDGLATAYEGPGEVWAS